MDCNDLTNIDIKKYKLCFLIDPPCVCIILYRMKDLPNKNVSVAWEQNIDDLKYVATITLHSKIISLDINSPNFKNELIDALNNL